MSSDSAFLRALGYLLGGRINHGSFSTIHNALQVSNAEVVAVKIIDLRNSCSSFRTRFLPRELANIQSLSHPNIIPVRKVARSEYKVFIIMDFARSNLKRHIELHSYVNEEQARKWFRQLASALEYLHRRRVAHRDIKVENILIDEHNNVKLCDFGFSKLIEKRNDQDDEHSTTFCGSLAYCAPEILLRTPYDPWKTDVWSLGVVLYKMVVGGMPFGEGNDLGSIKRIAKAHTKLVYFPPFPKTSQSCQDLIRALLTVETARRISMQDISKFQWVASHSLPAIHKRVKPAKVSSSEEKGDLPASILRGVVGQEIAPRTFVTPSVISRLRSRLPSLTSRNKNKKN